MDFGAAFFAALAIMVLVPLGAVWAAGRWRDPPRARWGITKERREAAADTPERRIERGLTDERKWTAVRRAVAKGTPAPEELRPAARELAGARIAELDAALAGGVRGLGLLAAGALVAVAAGVYLAFHGLLVLLAWGIYWVVRTYGLTPYALRRRRVRAEAAVAANA
jgi:hypothetical protein